MPTALDGVKHFLDAGILYAPARRRTAGGVATSGLEMMQNSQRMTWTRNEVDARLRGIMKAIHKGVLGYGGLLRHAGQLRERRQHRRLHQGGRRDDGPGIGLAII
jgi:glutamate dehydrogenase/leucine dehydrogenase